MTTEPAIDVAIVEDDPDQQRLIARILERAGLTLSFAATIHEGIERLQTQRPRVVVCGNELPDGGGIELLRVLRHTPDLVGTYFLLLSATPSRDQATCALEAGADDYLVKPGLHLELPARVRVGIRMWTMYDQLRRAAITDGLTGLNNHEHFYRMLEAEIARSRRYGHPLALIVLDLDFFKAVNDTHGHLVGNDVLREVARVLREAVRDVDTVARIGGEEFAIILPEANTTEAKPVAERIRIALPNATALRTARDHPVTASFGVADSDDPRVNCAADLVDLADRALYAAKRSGRNRVSLGRDLAENVESEASIEVDEVEWLRQRIAVLGARVRDVYVQSVATLLKVLDEKDPYAARHSVNVAFYAEQITREMKCSQAMRKSIYNAALLHDIGKVGVPDMVLTKRTTLTPVEQMVLDQVPLISTRIVDHMRILESEIQIIRHQREYFDGSGIPAGLKADQIPIGSRILLVADAFDAMTTDRVYRKRRPIDDVLDEIQRLAGKQFDPGAASALARVAKGSRAAWERRIQDTIRTTRLPGDEEIGVAADSFAPSTC